eukprot:1035217-Lingulodinium_polyedra.AAC.1
MMHEWWQCWRYGQWQQRQPRQHEGGVVVVAAVGVNGGWKANGVQLHCPTGVITSRSSCQLASSNA